MSRSPDDQTNVSTNNLSTIVRVTAPLLSSLNKITSYLILWQNNRINKNDERYYVRLGWQILIWCLGLLLTWAIFAPIDKGVSASGWVITDSNRKSIQPHIGGIIDDILVREGEHVITGQALIKLNPINAQSQRNATHDVIAGLQAQVKALTQSTIHKRKQSDLINKQLIGLRQLADEGYVPENRVRELERQQLQLQASISEDEGNLIRSQKQISETQEKLASHEYDLANTVLKSPVDGEVVNIQVFTKGGVVTPAQKLMEVIPSNESFLFEGQLPVHLVDKVHVGLSVEMMFTAFNVNRTPHIPGKIISVGADRLIEEKTGTPYYKILVASTPEGLVLLEKYKVKPGMPIELFIKTGEQTLMTYLLKPIIDRSRTALRED